MTYETQKVRLLLSAGNGPEECRIGLAKLVHKLETVASDLKLIIRCEAIGSKSSKLPPSWLVEIEGQTVKSFATAWTGTILWISPSPVRPKHKRKNWFMGVFDVSNLAPEDTDFVLAPSELSFDTFRAGGPGGQHQNTTDSAVRCTHKPSGISVVVRDQRSQHRNKQEAIKRLALKLSMQDADQLAILKAEERRLHHQLERGNPVKTFTGLDFRLN